MKRIKNKLLIITIFLFGINCNNSAGKKKEKEEIETILDESKNQRRIKIESFKEQINGLGTDCLSFSMDSIIFSNGQTIDSSIHKWLFGLEKKDSLQFKRADLIRPICKLNENNNILSVIFSDKYDYKSAIHIFNFRKSDFKPVSSFILYSVGGDAENFWNTKYKKLDNWNYEITETNGRYNNVESRDTTFIDLVKTINIRIDRLTGKLTSKEVKTEINIIEVN